jgi:N-acetylmuramoyl-L-alanine amidase CwlA
MTLHTKYMTRNDCYTAGRKITPRGIMLHSTAVPGVPASQWFSRWNKSFTAGEIDRRVCVHAFLDDKEVWQYLPWNHRGWHSGGAANDTHIGIEVCEPFGFSYGAGSVMKGYDAAKQAPYFNAAWKNAVDLCVMLCREFGLNETHIIDHAEGYRRGIASNHGDISHWLPKHGKNMDAFRVSVKAALNTAQNNNITEDEEVTQAEFNKMFAVAMTDYTGKLAAQSPSDWAKDVWEKMCAAGLFDGSSPRGNLTREQAAMVMSRVLK